MSTNVHTSPEETRLAQFLGLENRILITAEQTDGAISVVQTTVHPGAGAPLHTNTREALVWHVLEGTLTLHTEEGPVEVPAGSISFLPKGSTHTFTNATTQPVRALLVCVPGGFERFFLDVSDKLPPETPSGPPPQEAINVLVETAERYGLRIHPPENS